MVGVQTESTLLVIILTRYAMACPMRFVLAGISAILAFFLIWKNSITKDIGCEDSDEGRKVRWFVSGCPLVHKLIVSHVWCRYVAI